MFFAFILRSLLIFFGLAMTYAQNAPEIPFRDCSRPVSEKKSFACICSHSAQRICCAVVKYPPRPHPHVLLVGARIGPIREFQSGGRSDDGYSTALTISRGIGIAVFIERFLALS